MDIEKISAELRPRRPWEAIDLGISLCRLHLGKLMLFWSLSVLPVTALLSFLLWGKFFLLFFLLWWVKPLFDRVPLFYLSRALFGSAPTTREFFKVLPKLWTHRFFDALIVSRFSFVRSLVMPIKELEGLKGSQYAGRRNALLRSGSGQAQWFLVSCFFLTMLFTDALILLVLTAVPALSPPDHTTLIEAFWDMIVSGKGAVANKMAFGFLCYFAFATAIVENLYVAGGFGLYLNARTELEGWDVELTFRRIANRIRTIQASSLTVLVTTILLLAGTGSIHAQNSDPASDPPDAAIERILEHEEFNIETRTQRVRSRESSESGERSDFQGSLSFLGLLGQLLFWALVIALIVFLVIMIYKNRHLFVPSRRAQDEVSEPRARTILGMEITADSLPNDLVAAARQAWQSGQKKEALSLLYRGTISWLVESAQSPIRESDTEYDCLCHARRTPAATTRIGYIETLTGTWTGVAYGRQDPGDEQMEELLGTWPFNPGGGKS